jgi:hypothetical protein
MIGRMRFHVKGRHWWKLFGWLIVLATMPALFRSLTKRRRSEPLHPPVPAGQPGAVLLEAIIHRIAAHDDQLRSLNTTVSFTLTSASILVAGAAALVEALRLADPRQQWSWLTIAAADLGFIKPSWLSYHNCLLVGGVGVLLIYTGVVLYSVQAYGLQNFERTPYPPSFFDRYYDKEPEYIRMRLAASLAEDFRKNELPTLRKAVLADRAIFFFKLQAIVMLLWLCVILIGRVPAA